MLQFEVRYFYVFVEIRLNTLQIILRIERQYRMTERKDGLQIGGEFFWHEIIESFAVVTDQMKSLNTARAIHAAVQWCKNRCLTFAIRKDTLNSFL